MNPKSSFADIAMFVHNDVTHDSRVRKEAATLAAQGWRVVVVGVSLSGKPLPEQEFIFGFTVLRVTPRLLSGLLPGTFGKLIRLVAALPLTIRLLRRANARVYHGHDFVGLLALALAGIWRRPVIYDSHELFFDRYPKGLFNYPLKYVIHLMRPLEKLLAQRAKAVVTVSDGLADVLAARLSISRPTVVRNAVDLRHLAPPSPIERPQGQILLIHTGNLATGRHLHELVSSLVHLPETVSLLLLGGGSLKTALLAHAQSLNIEKRVIFMPPVSPDAVTSTLSQGDVAAVLTSPTYEIALPNKFFEAVASGIPMVCSPLPEIVRLVKQYELGEICNPSDPSSIAQAVMKVLQPENHARISQNAFMAREVLNWNTEEKKLIELYAQLLQSDKTG